MSESGIDVVNGRLACEGITRYAAPVDASVFTVLTPMLTTPLEPDVDVVGHDGPDDEIPSNAPVDTTSHVTRIRIEATEAPRR